MYNIKEFDGGVRLIYKKAGHAKSVSAGIFIKSGSVYESGKFNGISHFIEHMLFKGTPTHSALDISTLSELVGGRLNAYTDRECTCVYTRVLPEDLDISLDLMGDMVLNSLFDEKSIKTEKKVVLEEIKMYEDNPEEFVHDILSEITYPSHPIGKPIVGTEKTVKGFNSKLIKEYIKNRYCGNNIVISVTGNFDESALIDKVGTLFENVRKNVTSQEINPADFTPAKKTIKKQVEQSHIVLAFEGYPSNCDEKYALNLVTGILGGSTNSRLFQKVREERGLAYSVYACPNIFSSASYTSVYAACAPEKLDTLQEILLSEIEDLYLNGITEKELEFAKKHFETSFVLSSENLGSIMSAMGRGLLLKGRVKTDEEILSKIRSVDLDAANRAAKLFNPDKFSCSKVTP